MTNAHLLVCLKRSFELRKSEIKLYFLMKNFVLFAASFKSFSVCFGLLFKNT